MDLFSAVMKATWLIVFSITHMLVSCFLLAYVNVVTVGYATTMLYGIDKARERERLNKELKRTKYLSVIGGLVRTIFAANF